MMTIVFPLYGIDFSLPLSNPVLLFSLILFIILFTPILLNRFKIPPLIGLILAGAIIGPNGFNLIARDMSIVLFGTVGLQYIMFLAGLEIDLNEFKKNSFKSLVFGLLTFLVPMSMGTYGSYFILGYSWPTSILLASMFASHTLIAYPLVSKLGVAKNLAVNVTVGGTMITDTLALLVLAVITGMQVGEINEEFWYRLGISFVLFSVIVLVVFPLVGRWFFKRFDDSVSQYIFVLGIVFLGCTLAELAGVEAIIGAFLTGLALNRLIPHTSPLMNRIEFVGNALFIPFFLIGVGMLIDYRAFFKDTNTIIVAGFMTFVALFSKYIAAFVTQKIFKFNKDEGRLIFGLSSAQAAATLAAVLVGYNIVTSYEDIKVLKDIKLSNKTIQTVDNSTLKFVTLNKFGNPVVGSKALLNGDEISGELVLSNKYKLNFDQSKLTNIQKPNRLLNDNILNGTILMILITCTIASFVAQKGAYNLALLDQEDNDEDENNAKQQDEQILIPLKTIETVEELVNFAVTIKSKKSKNNLYALNVIKHTSLDGKAENASNKIVDKAASVASSSDNLLFPISKFDPNLINGILDVVNQKNITDIILGQTDQYNNIGSSMFGPVNDAIINKTSSTTYLVKYGQPISTVKRYLVVIPDNAEREIGFSFWLLKIWNLAKNTGAKVDFYGNATSIGIIKQVQEKSSIQATFQQFSAWEDFLILSREIKKDDCLVVIMSRKQQISYNSMMQNIPNYLNKYFDKNNSIIIYPIQKIDGVAFNLQNPAALDTFTENLERLEDLTKFISKIFKFK